MQASPPRVPFLHYHLQAAPLHEMIRVLHNETVGSRALPALVVTLNPEIVMQAEQLEAVKHTIMNAKYVVADGIGVVWGTKQLGHPVPGRVPGVELAMGLLAASDARTKVFLLGGKPGVSERAAATVATTYEAQVAGHHHGYFDRENASEIVQMVRSSGANLLLAGLGEGQEQFLATHQHEWGVNVMIGVGGTLDVLAGEVKRMPTITQKLRLEWLFRILLDRSRWHRFPRLLQYVRFVLKQKHNR